jgi:hypothetical protein
VGEAETLAERQDKISPTDFFAGDAEKTKINWLCFEYAAQLQTIIATSLKKKLKRIGIGEADIARFCIHYSKTMKEQILRMSAGEFRAVHLSPHPIKRFFPSLNDKLVNDLLNAAHSARDELTQICVVCPVKCISDKNGRAKMFDDPDYYE